MEWGLVVLVFVLLWGLGPYTLYYANIMLRVPPFVDDDDYDVITQIVVMSALRSLRTRRKTCGWARRSPPRPLTRARRRRTESLYPARSPVPATRVLVSLLT